MTSVIDVQLPPGRYDFAVVPAAAAPELSFSRVEDVVLGEQAVVSDLVLRPQAQTVSGRVVVGVVVW